MTDTECADFGRILRSALRRLRSARDDPPYNFAVESFDFLGRDAPHAHWRLRIAPDLVTRAGFELAAGVPINPSEPEADADLLRKAPPHDQASDATRQI
jgi:galactose-1-phosphate uridylyltransferase